MGGLYSSSLDSRAWSAEVSVIVCVVQLEGQGGSVGRWTCKCVAVYGHMKLEEFSAMILNMEIHV